MSPFLGKLRKKNKPAPPVASGWKPLLTISDPSKSPSAGDAQTSFGRSVKNSFMSLWGPRHRMRNMFALGSLLLLLGGGLFLGARSELFRGFFDATPTYERLASMKLSPDVKTVSVGEEFDVDVLLNTGGLTTEGVDLNLTYDKNALNVVDANAGAAGIQITQGTLYTSYAGNSVDKATGKITLIGFNQLGVTFSNNRNDVFAKIRFKALQAAASAEVKFIYETNPDLILSDDSNVTSRLNDESVGDVLGKITNAVYTIGGTAQEELFIEITTNDGKDIDTDKETQSLKGITSPDTARIFVNDKKLDDYDAGDERWNARIDLDDGRNRITVRAENADKTKMADDTISIRLKEEQDDTDRDQTQNPDRDGDGIPNIFETENGLNPDDPLDAALDPDGDTCTSLKEFQNKTNPRNKDTDGDGIPDCWEIDHGLNPTDPGDAAKNPDGDTCTNFDEFLRSSDPSNPDTDGDGITDCDDPSPLTADLQTAPTTPVPQPQPQPQPQFQPQPQPMQVPVDQNLSNQGPSLNISFLLFGIACILAFQIRRTVRVRI